MSTTCGAPSAAAVPPTEGAAEAAGANVNRTVRISAMAVILLQQRVFRYKLFFEISFCMFFLPFLPVKRQVPVLLMYA
jgi:hypothetical protein